jgi:CheY-like chemotaxis protein
MGVTGRILVVDDDPIVLRLTSILFNRAGHEVHVATDGVEGLAKVDEIKPDLVILDVMMPGLSGLEVCQRLRANPATARLPVLLLSATEPTSWGAAGDPLAGANGFIKKTASADELLARAASMLQAGGLEIA